MAIQTDVAARAPIWAEKNASFWSFMKKPLWKTFMQNFERFFGNFWVRSSD